MIRFYEYCKISENMFIADERCARGGEVEGEGGEGGPAMLNQRLINRIAQLNSTS